MTENGGRKEYRQQWFAQRNKRLGMLRCKSYIRIIKKEAYVYLLDWQVEKKISKIPQLSQILSVGGKRFGERH